jgi:hypothetical protein
LPNVRGLAQTQVCATIGSTWNVICPVTVTEPSRSDSSKIGIA